MRPSATPPPVRSPSPCAARALSTASTTSANDKPVARFPLASTDSAESFAGVPDADSVPQPVRETFHDALADHRDLLGVPCFRNKPADDSQRRLFAAAFDAATKIRANSSVLAIDTVLFCLNPSLFAAIDCFARDTSGAFWLFSCSATAPKSLPFAAYALQHGEYVPAKSQIRLGHWLFTPSGPKFSEVALDPVAVRDTIITRIQEVPFP